jgi:hypothetical protein
VNGILPMGQRRYPLQGLSNIYYLHYENQANYVYSRYKYDNINVLVSKILFSHYTKISILVISI